MRGGLQYGLVKRANASLIGQGLIAANWRSLHARYNDELPPLDDDLVLGYELPAELPKLQPSAIYSCTACFQYQACEYTEWHGSGAQTFTLALQDRIARHRPEIRTRYDGGLGRSVSDGQLVAEFPWGINDAAPEALDPYHLTTNERNP